MKNNGFITLHRDILTWKWYQNINVKTLFIHCLLKANHKNGDWQLEKLKRGQFVTSLRRLSVETGLSERQVRTALDKLILTSELTIKTTTKYRIITVLKYNDYQMVDKQLDKQLTNKRQTVDKQTTTNNKDNNEKNDEKVIKDIPYQKIVNILNEKADKHFKYQTAKTRNLIKARINEGFEYKDFERVIFIKTAEWINTEMDLYLRPETLFGTKFEGYLNQKEIKTATGKNLLPKDIESDWLDDYIANIDKKP